tara:strand:+ start:10054 stop:11160 length:1107 start_codon:yes stop_codon:yes gene_type:complete
MVFNKSWAFLKSNDFQTKLPMHDPRLDYTTGWEGWDPVRAVRVQGAHRPAGEPVPQDGSNINYEEGDPRLPPLIPEIPHDNDPVWDDPNSRWRKDPISNVPYYMAGAHRDGKYHPRARKLFAGLKNAKAGTWVSNNTMGDINNLYTHNAPDKLVYVRGNLDKYGKVHRRDSDEAKEDLAEAFIEHDENIPRESLVEVPLRRHYKDETLEMGTPNLGRNIRHSDRQPSGRISRWSDKPVPWGKPIKRKEIEDMDADELHNLFYGKTKDEIYELTKGSPMEIAFQLLKERKSPAAFAHKLEYDKQYQKDPKRVKYREQLNTERRKRGIYGKGGKDVSHTQGGKLTLESPHANRARHFKNRGTLRRVKVKK